MNVVRYPHTFEELDIRPYDEGEIVNVDSPIYYQVSECEYRHLVRQICMSNRKYLDLTFIMWPEKICGKHQYFMKVNGSPALIKDLVNNFPANWEASVKASLDACVLEIKKNKGLV